MTPALIKVMEAKSLSVYGYSRLREMVLDGVTHSILGDAAVPVLLMH